MPPVNSGEAAVEKVTLWEVPAARVAVTVFDTDWPWITDLDPPLEREKSKGGGGGGGMPPFEECL